MADYIKDISRASTFHESERVHCDKASLKSCYSSTLTEIDIICAGDASILCDHSSTIKINRLVCPNLHIDVKYSSTVIIKDIDIAGLCNVDVDHSSTLIIRKGKIHTIEGGVTHVSTGKCRAMVENDKVTPGQASRWIT